MRMFPATALVCCAMLYAQSPADVFEKAPPAVDQALRERVKIFFQAHVDGKFRLAEQVIAEDSKDAFYNSEKRRYISFEIIRINYSDNYTKATVITNVEMDWYTARLGKMRVKPPMKTLWKQEDGQWWWYVVPQTDWETPFGKMSPGQEPQGAVKPKWTGPDAATVLAQVKTDRPEVDLSGFDKSSAAVEITNTVPGEISLKIDQPNLMTGLTMRLQKDTLKSGETTKLVFEYAPPDRTPKMPVDVTVTVSPTSQVLRIKLNFSIAPEYEKLIPKTQ